MNRYEVAVAAPLADCLTYGQPEGTAQTLPVGIRVLVPLGNRLVTGYLLGPAVRGDDSFPIKPIAELLDPEPLFSKELVPFFRWIGDYYHYPLGEVIRTALPGGLTARSGREVKLTPSGQRRLPAELDKLSGLAGWMEKLMTGGRLTAGTVRSLWRKPAEQRLLKKWQQNGWLEIRELVVASDVQPRKVTTVCLGPTLSRQIGNFPLPDAQQLPAAVSDLSKTERKTLNLFARIGSGRTTLPRPELTRNYSGAGKALHRLVDRGLVTLEEQRCYRDPFGTIPVFFPQPECLTPDQELVLGELVPAVEERRFQPFLLHGVTGCGKTEVYLRAAQRCLAIQRTVLVLVPEIALASQVEAHFYSRFGDTLAVLHSGLSVGERFDQWQRIQQRKAAIVIGARSAVFAPMSDLGLVIVDEEHEPAYKQDSGLCYNGRDMAVLRARMVGCPVILGSATPSVTSYYHARQNKYRLLTMPSRVSSQPMPDVEIVDLAKVQRSRPDLFFSDQLIAALHDNMEKRMQSLLYVNRRGFSSFMLCRDCGHIVQCRHCKVSLTHHRQHDRLICHYCGYSISPQVVCPECGSSSVSGMGVGSERVEAEVRQLLPHAATARLDSDTTMDRKKYMAILKQVRDHKIDILIGTQMVAKGLHFPNMTLVGVIWADSGLAMPDYKASERAFQLLAQVTGRAGRGDHPGRVIVQTHQPGHYAIEFARQHDYERLYEQEQQLRSRLAYPPFSRLVNIRLSGEIEEQVAGTARKAGHFLRSRSINSGLDILGPAPAPLSRVKNRYRWQLLIKGSDLPRLHDLCEQVLDAKKKLCPAGVRMVLDVDPENMM